MRKPTKGATAHCCWDGLERPSEGSYLVVTCQHRRRDGTLRRLPDWRAGPGEPPLRVSGWNAAAATGSESSLDPGTALVQCQGSGGEVDNAVGEINTQSRIRAGSMIPGARDPSGRHDK